MARPKKAEPSKVIGITISASFMAKVDKARASMGLTRSEFCRVALAQYMQQLELQSSSMNQVSLALAKQLMGEIGDDS